MKSAPSSATKIWGALRPNLPWAFGLALILLLAGLYAPQRVMNWLSWQLYLDRLSSIFAVPVGFAGRAIVAVSASLLLFLLSMMVGLLLPKGKKSGSAQEAEDAPTWRYSPRNSSISDAISREIGPFSSSMGVAIPQRNSADIHPDDAPRPPLRAESELPAGGLGPLRRADLPLSGEPSEPAADDEADQKAGQMDAYRPAPAAETAPTAPPEAPILVLADMMLGAGDNNIANADANIAALKAEIPVMQGEAAAAKAANMADLRDATLARPSISPAKSESKSMIASDSGERKSLDDNIIPGQEPWLQSVESSGAAKPPAKDLSLSAMVARLEAGLSSRRRAAQPLVPSPSAIPVLESAPAPTVEDHKVDVALEAALGTLKRMNIRAVG